MQEFHTHIFIGGPYDGRREAVGDGRGSINIGVQHPLKPAGVAMSSTLYERTAYQGEKQKFIFWKAQGLSLDDALKKLFAGYVNLTVIGPDGQPPLTPPPPAS